ncbi:MAG: hypothetical protein GYA12_05275 [Chloroflexi bacterium]|nr:hypothetical protein [Chloroflexota bacterium]
MSFSIAASLPPAEDDGLSPVMALTMERKKPVLPEPGGVEDGGLFMRNPADAVEEWHHLRENSLNMCSYYTE